MAIDVAYRRRSYLALTQTGRGVIAIPNDLSTTGELIGASSYTSFPARHDDRIWLCDPSGQPRGAVHQTWEVGRDGRPSRKLTVPAGALLRAETEAGFIVEVGAECFLWDGKGKLRPLTAKGWFLGVVGATILWVPSRSPAVLTLRSLQGEADKELTHRLIDRWAWIAMRQSPDANSAAIPVKTINQGKGGLAVVDLIAGELAVADGDYDGYSYSPVWSRDGATIYLGLPFEGRIAAIVLDTLRLVRLPLRRAPMPLIEL